MRRVLLHLGYHKTGTTTAQGFLQANRKQIFPRYALMLPKKIRQSGLTAIASQYAKGGDKHSLDRFRRCWSRMLAQVHFGKRRGLIVSDEILAGPRPGRMPEQGYVSTADIANCMIEELHRIFAPEDCEITVYLSLRNDKDWLRSLWSHELRKTDLTETLEQFSQRVSAVLSLEDRAEQVARQLRGATLVTHRLEELSPREFGLGTPFAEFLRAGPGKFDDFEHPDRRNSGPTDAVLGKFLELNRADLDPETRKRLKAEARRIS